MRISGTKRYQNEAFGTVWYQNKAF